MTKRIVVVSGLVILAMMQAACGFKNNLLDETTASTGAMDAVPQHDRRELLAGTWEYRDGGVVYSLKLDQKGNGAYNWKDGYFVTSSLSNRVWHGTWHQAENDREGGFEVRMSDDYSEGEGRWWYTRIADDVAPINPGGSFYVDRVTPKPQLIRLRDEN